MNVVVVVTIHGRPLKHVLGIAFHVAMANARDASNMFPEAG
jgi:hypothetical protein